MSERNTEPMSMSDPLADMLTRMRNALQAGHSTFDVPASRLKTEVCRVLREQGYIDDYAMEAEPAPGLLRVTLKYLGGQAPAVQGVRRISKPSLRVYRSAHEVAPVLSGLGISILSTSKGVMTGKQARQQGVGGEVLCEVW